jgi:hypothetical protein
VTANRPPISSSATATRGRRLETATPSSRSLAPLRTFQQCRANPAEWSWPDLPSGSWLVDDSRDWNKLGGTPLFLQGEEWPPGDGWHFAFQFTAGAAGAERGDGAECYGYINDDGRAAFAWQGH